MDFGLHLPLMDFGGNPFTLDHLITYAETGQQLGFSALAANDHLVYSKPWLDGPTTLATVLSHSGSMDLATTVSLPVVRGPVPLAKCLGAIDRLSGGRLIACVGPGSSERDYAVVGIPLMNVGNASMRPFKLYGPFGIGRVRSIKGASTTRKGSCSSRSRPRSPVHPSGWEVGAPRLDCDELPAWPMVGWHRDTIRPQNYSPKIGNSFKNSLSQMAKMRLSQTPSPPCGFTSLNKREIPNGCSMKC